MATIIMVLAVLFGLLTIRSATSEDIPIVAYILNACPEVLEVSIHREDGTMEESIDPGVEFIVELYLRDNNTICDITSIGLILYSPESTEFGSSSEKNHYRFRWDADQGFSNEGGFGEVAIGKCSKPQEMSLGEGTWIFAIKFEKSALCSNEWTLLAIASDEAEQGRSSRGFGVNMYSSICLDESEISFSGSPGSLVPADQNVILLRCSANHQSTLGCWSTSFVGAENSEIELEPSSFVIDDDADPFGQPEVGLDSLVLSDKRQVFSGSLLPAKDAEVHVYLFVQIPDPFYDQDYTGRIFFDLGS